MTVAPEPPVRPARRFRARTRGLIAGLVAAAALVASPLSAVADTTPSPTPSPTPGEAIFTLAPVGNGILRPGEALYASVTLENGTAASVEPGNLALEFSDEALATRAALDSWLAGETADVALTEVASEVIGAVGPGAEQTDSLVVAADAPGLSGLTPGVYPLVATLTTATRTFTSTSAIIVPDDSASPIGLGIVVPITAPATAEGLLTALELTDLTAPNGSLTAQLDAVDDTEAILAVDPAIPAAIRALGTSAPPSALSWLARLEGLANSRFALQFGDADVAAEVQAGLVPPLQPTSLQAYLAPVDFAPVTEPSQEPTPTPSPSVDPLAPVYPDLDTLLDIGAGRAGVFWPATGTAGAAVVETLGALTVDDQHGLTMIPSETTAQGADGSTVAARGSDHDAGALIYDSAVSRELHEASLQGESAIRGAHLTAATAYLAFAVGETDGAPLLVTLDRGEDRSRVALRTAITTALGAPAVKPITLGGVVNSTAASVAVDDAAVDDARVATASALASEEAALTQFATILSDPSLLTGPERAEILQLLGNAWIPTPEPWNAAVIAHRAETAETLDSVGILPPSQIQLISSGAGIPVWVRNDLPYPVTVQLLASPDDLRLEVQPVTVVTALPNSNTRAEVPVQAQIGNGDVTLTLSLQSTAGVAIGQPQYADVHVRADWEGIGIVILAILAGGLLVLGLVRTLLRRRNARRSAEVASDAPTPEDPAP